MKDVAIVYMVAGLSSRFGGKIKQFAKVTEKETLIEYSLKQALSCKFSKIIFIVGNKTEEGFRKMFGNSYKNIPVYYAYQKFDLETRDKPWGTMDALCSIKNIINCDFIICNGDDIYGENTFKILFNHLQNSEEEATVGYELLSVLPEKGEVNRGIFNIKDNYIQDIKETFNISKENFKSMELKENTLCSQNIFAFHPNVVNLANKKLILFKEKNKSDRKIECLLPNEISNLIKEGKIKMKLYSVYDKWLGITNPGDEDEIKRELEKLEKKRK